jgi:GNAT superfamily N-acetyltransferase
MTKDAQFVSLSAMDEERFGIKTAKAFDVRKEDIPLVLEYCHKNQVELLITRCPTLDYIAVHEMEKVGFLIMDTLIYFSCRLRGNSIPDAPGFQVRSLRSGEEDIIKSIATEAFKGYLSHYHADERLDKRKCDEVYADWAYRSCYPGNGTDDVLVADSGNRIIGFGTMRINIPDEGEGLLFAVEPSFQGKGFYRSIMTSCMKWCVERGLEHMIISTQITNLASQKTWTRLGFEPTRSCYTFHKWFHRDK